MADDDRKFTAQDFATDAIGDGTHAIDLDGQVTCMMPDVRDALIERGLLYCDSGGTWRLRSHGFPDLSPASAMGYLAVCDFCGARPAPWTIPCASFEMPPISPLVPRGVSEGDWAACDTCGASIAKGERANFLSHCARKHDHPEMPREFRRMMKKAQQQLHARFWQHYRGGAWRGKVRPVGH